MRILSLVVKGLLVLSLLACFQLNCQAEAWRAVDPALLAEKTPVVEKDADVEAIFRDVRITEFQQGDDFMSKTHHYVRLKVFTERGKERLSKIEIPYWGQMNITDIEGRTTKTDGTIVPLKKEAIFERPLGAVSATDRPLGTSKTIKIKAKSFAMPAIEVGVVAEYQFTINRPVYYFAEFELQQDYPVREVAYHIKPYESRSATGIKAGYASYNIPFQQPKLEGNGFDGFHYTDVPSLKKEPYMPPTSAVGRWLLVYYTDEFTDKPDQYWKKFGQEEFSASKLQLKISGEIKQAAAEATAGASTPEEKIEKLLSFVRSKVKNRSDSDSDLSGEERRKAKSNKSPADTLKQGVGNSREIQNLFGALAIAAGFDARLAPMSDRSEYFFNKDLYANGYFLDATNVAIKIGNSWQICDPVAKYLPAGMLDWNEEYTQALIPDKTPIFVTTPLSPPEKSKAMRKATLELSEDGTLEGDVVMQYTGHLGADKKEYNDGDSPTQREETLKEMIKNQMDSAELTNIKVENVTDPVAPFQYSFHIRVPGYALRTGKRFFFEPAFFQKGNKPKFSSSQRKYNILFDYPWSEEDDVTIKLPAGYILENTNSPIPTDLGDTGKDEIRYVYDRSKNLLECHRRFFFGGGNAILFPAESYAAVKQAFDSIQRQDTQTVSLRQATQ